MSEGEKSKKGLHCDVCNTYIPNEASLAAHLKGKKHVQNVERIKNREQEAEKSLYISGLQHLNAVELVLADHFSKYGPVAKITVDKSKGLFAILEFSDKESATKALGEEKHLLSGQEITVKPRQVKMPVAKKPSNDQHHMVHNQMPADVWKALFEAEDVQSQFYVLQNTLSLTENDKHVRDLVCQLLEVALEEVFHGCKIKPFGSSVNGFGIHGCDLDLNFSYDTVDYQTALQFLMKDAHVDKGCLDENENKVLSKKQTLSSVAAIIRMCVPDCHQVKSILSARQPVVKFHHKVSQMCCDISTGNEFAVRNTEFLKHLCDNVPYFTTLVKAIRLWMRHWNLAGSSRAASPLLNNYAVTLMVLFYLYDVGEIHTIEEMRSTDAKLQPYLIENWDFSFSCMSPLKKQGEGNSLSQLFAGFFHFYSKFDFANKVLCLKTGKQEDSNECKAKVESQITPLSGPNKRPFKFGALNIRDPFVLDHNVAGNVGNKHMLTFIRCIRNAALACDMKLYCKKSSAFDSKEPWGILNLFVDHHAKKVTRPSSRKNSFSDNSTFSIEINCKVGGGSQNGIVSLIMTILTDVFLVDILTEGVNNDMEMEDSVASAPENQSAQTTVVNLRQFSKEVEKEESSASLEQRKRQHDDSPVTQKRARLSLNSPEALNLRKKAFVFLREKELKFPIEMKCEVRFRVWEGRRKARRHLVQPGGGDILDLERQISKLLVTESNVETEGANGVSSMKGATSPSKAGLKTSFQFNLLISKTIGDVLVLTFEFKQAEEKMAPNSEQDFRNFVHHLEISLPNMVTKCLKVA